MVRGDIDEHVDKIIHSSQTFGWNDDEVFCGINQCDGESEFWISCTYCDTYFHHNCVGIVDARKREALDGNDKDYQPVWMCPHCEIAQLEPTPFQYAQPGNLKLSTRLREIIDVRFGNYKIDGVEKMMALWHCRWENPETGQLCPDTTWEPFAHMADADLEHSLRMSDADGHPTGMVDNIDGKHENCVEATPVGIIDYRIVVIDPVANEKYEGVAKELIGRNTVEYGVVWANKSWDVDWCPAWDLNWNEIYAFHLENDGVPHIQAV